LGQSNTKFSLQSIQHDGGTMLGSSRGGFDEATILAWLKAHGVNIGLGRIVAL
jgi:hypothetical protein